MSDCGFTHVALPVGNLDASIAFYAKYAQFRVVHQRTSKSDDQKHVAWLSDLMLGFVLVLVESDAVEHPLGPFAHLGVAVESNQKLDELCAMARRDGCLREGPYDSGPPVGRWALLDDPDRHTLELSFGQDIRWAVEQSRPK